jgi:positive regulator of sigma E activity
MPAVVPAMPPLWPEIAAMLILLTPPVVLYALILFVAPRLGQQRRWLFFCAACLAIGALLGLIEFTRVCFGLIDVRPQALVSLVFLILAGLDFNRRYPGKRY